jgi:hypothetical protein
MAFQIAAKLLVTAILLFLIISVWSGEIDIRRTLTAPLTAIIKFKEHATFDIDARQIIAARLPVGLLGFLFYDLKFVNLLNENVTLKQIEIRYSFEGRDYETDSLALVTGDVYTPKGEVVPSLLLHLGQANLFLMNWSNLRQVIGRYTTLPHGSVLVGSAAFALEGLSQVSDLEKLKTIEMVATDFSGNETVKKLIVSKEWIEPAKMAVVEGRVFTNKNGAITY